MCLSIPGKIVSIGEKISVDYGGEVREADFSLIDVNVGDYVIINNKIIITKLSEESAKKFLSTLEG
jgi:hydrogenase assembly chaperone HypC/HupF